MRKIENVKYGKHCEYCHQLDQEVNSILGKMIFGFIKKCEKD